MNTNTNNTARFLINYLITFGVMAVAFAAAVTLFTLLLLALVSPDTETRTETETVLDRDFPCAEDEVIGMTPDAPEGECIHIENVNP